MLTSQHMHNVQEDFKAGRGIELLDLETLNGETCMHASRTTLHAAGLISTEACYMQALCLWWRCRTTQTSLVRNATLPLCARAHAGLRLLIPDACTAASALEQLSIPSGTLRVIFKTLNTQLCALGCSRWYIERAAGAGSIHCSMHAVSPDSWLQGADEADGI